MAKGSQKRGGKRAAAPMNKRKKGNGAVREEVGANESEGTMKVSVPNTQGKSDS